ncbi:TetR/AcrR family transcriptional regulator [Nocardia sp. 2]|uniref:TetR/AcrR family transcriptional regulator n=1 Tax=Nocardia acididurans TaxID=2802282 RepID=A0ABS1M8M7_9NOCA|nr:TetR/AcrR family transcriptional regulator [Nocardia acididurans]MBL1076495.1 TetR/AcrR family transcriptional regulator [Nocardia acididurans]
MPLPRFTRLPTAEQRRILDVAQRAFAADGIEAASYNQIIAAAGISKSSAYNYFDGRDDLLRAVLDGVAARLTEALGPWTKVATPAEFWQQIKAAEFRLRAHIDTRPEDLALIDPAFLLGAQSTFVAWIRDLVDNGAEIGLVTVECDRDLLVQATAAVIRAGDAWAAAALREGRDLDPDQPWNLIRNLWGVPPRP